jgi:hypothetical protein
MLKLSNLKDKNKRVHELLDRTERKGIKYQMTHLLANLPMCELKTADIHLLQQVGLQQFWKLTIAMHLTRLVSHPLHDHQFSIRI